MKINSTYILDLNNKEMPSLVVKCVNNTIALKLNIELLDVTAGEHTYSIKPIAHSDKLSDIVIPPDVKKTFSGDDILKSGNNFITLSFPILTVAGFFDETKNSEFNAFNSIDFNIKIDNLEKVHTVFISQ